VPSIDQARLSFAVFVRASPPAPIAHEGARIGAVFIPVAPGSAATLRIESDRGLIVSDVASDGSAAKAGIQRGDVLLSVDGSPVNSLADLTSAVNAAAPRHKAEFEMSRNGSILDVTIPL
jgi:serine protease Do